MRIPTVVWVLFAVAFAGAGSGVALGSDAPLVVDDDGAQCGGAQYDSIQEAVDDAAAGAVVRVCPGVYVESVVVDKPLTLHGVPTAVEQVDCFASSLPALSPQEQVLVKPATATDVGFVLEASGVEVAGFVVEGGSIGVVTHDRSAVGAPLSGYRVRHNLFRLQRQFLDAAGTLQGGYGVEVGAGGGSASRVDHNCIRETERIGGPGWGIAADNGDVVDVRIDHNSTYRLTIGVEIAGIHRHERLAIDHNLSREELDSVALWTSSESVINANKSGGGRTAAIVVGGANEGLQVRGNEIDAGFQGIVFSNAFFGRAGSPVSGALVRDNVITRLRSDGIVGGPGFLQSSLITENVVTDGGRDGIVIRTGNSGNTVSGNIVDRSAANGIFAQGASSNAFVGNSMHGNGTDARDTGTSNQWLANACDTSVPAGLC